MRGDRMTFDKSQAAQIRQRLVSKDDDFIDYNYWNAHAAAMFPAMMDLIAELEEQLSVRIQSCDALPMLHAKDEEMGRQLIEIHRLETKIAELEKAVAEKDAYINDDSNARLNQTMAARIIELENDKALFDQTMAGHCFELAKQLAEHKAIIPEPGDADRLKWILRNYPGTLGKDNCEMIKRYWEAIS